LRLTASPGRNQQSDQYQSENAIREAVHRFLPPQKFTQCIAELVVNTLLGSGSIGYPFWASHEVFMSKPELSNYTEYIIRDADSYGAVLSEASLEISQLEPGCLSGRHVRLGLPGGQFSNIETSAQLRGNGTFSNLWTLSVILGSTTRSRRSRRGWARRRG
jgi:hypothetical protein